MALSINVETIIELATVRTNNFHVTKRKRLVRRKVHHLNLSERQVRLLEKINKLKSITFFEALAEDWRVLGGLFNRGLVEWFDSNNLRCIRPVGNATKAENVTARF